jgi:hypothetical protein
MTDSAKPDDNDKIKGTQPRQSTTDATSRPVERAAEKVDKPAEEPVDRTADLLQSEFEVTKAGIPAPDDEEHRPAR